MPRLDLKRHQVRTKVLRRISLPILESMTQYVKEAALDLWGEQKPDSFIDDAVLLAMYKDIFAVGYKRLADDVSFGYKIADKSLRHNTQHIRRCLATWAEQHVQREDLAAWKHHARNLGLPKEVATANLWMDSTDIKLQQKKAVRGKKSPWYSYKLKQAGQRYMFIRNGQSKIVQIWGGYSPKVYDGHWLKDHKTELNEHYKGAVMIADNHFTQGKKVFTNITFLTNYAERKKAVSFNQGGPAEEDTVDNLTAERKNFNRAHSHGRARIQSPFGCMIQKFDSLAKPWSESQNQQDYLVMIAAAVYNLTI